MRLGLFLSTFLHLVVIGFGIFTISGANFDMQADQIELVPVELVSVGDVMALREGEESAEPQDKPAPIPTQKPAEKPEDRHAGDGQSDSPAPLRPQERPRAVEAPPPPSGQLQPQIPAQQQEEFSSPPSEPEFAAVTQTISEPESQVTTISEPTEEAAVVTEADPMPDSATESASAEQISQQMSGQTAGHAALSIPQLPQQAPVPQRKPQNSPAVAVRQTARETPAEHQQTALSPPSGEESLENVLNQNTALIDRTPTQGGGARRSPDEQGFGARRDIGDDAALVQTIQNVIGGCIKRNARTVLLTGSQSYDLVVRVHLKLNRDGSIAGVPNLTPVGGDANEREIATTQGFAALTRCAPFAGLPPEQYDKWFDVTINWRPLEH